MHKKMPKHPWSVVAVVGMLLLTAVGLLWGVAVRVEDNSAVMPFITIMIGVIAAALPGLIGAIRTEQIHEDMKNGTLKQNVKEAIVETVEDKNNDVKGFFMDHHDTKESGHVDVLIVLVMFAVAIIVVTVAFLFIR